MNIHVLPVDTAAGSDTDLLADMASGLLSQARGTLLVPVLLTAAGVAGPSAAQTVDTI
jgi:hypothetical protein